MTVNPALKEDLNDKNAPVKPVTDVLHRDFVLWKEQSGKAVSVIANMLNRSPTAVSQYLNKKYAGNVVAIEKDIQNLLLRHNNLEFAAGNTRGFCNTHASTLIWEVLEYCDGKCKMGVALAPSGTGKSTACIEYKRQNRMSILVTAHIRTRTDGAIIRLIAKQALGGVTGRSISDTLDRVVDRLTASKRLLIIDDAHFLSWEAYEIVRKLHDCAGVGVVYVGQERLYEQMRGASNKAYLYDQIYSRIAIKRSNFAIRKKDVRMITDTICPGLDKACIDFLYQQARGKGRLRVVDNLLDMAMQIHKEFNRPLDAGLLREAERLLMS